MKYLITKVELGQMLDEGLSTRKIAEQTGYSSKMISCIIDKYELKHRMKYQKRPPFYVGKIDTKEKAYLLGFAVCDSSISQTKMVELAVALADKEVLDFLAPIIDGEVHTCTTLDKKVRRFPRARMNKKIPDICTFVGGEAKTDRHFPIANSELARYVLMGAFDADGCITWGRRKDKNRIWHKVSFTSSLKILTGIQQFLLKQLDISTIIRPKSNHENCFVIEFANRKDVLKFIDYIYQDDFVVLKRKYLKAQALRLELEENGKGAGRP